MPLYNIEDPKKKKLSWEDRDVWSNFAEKNSGKDFNDLWGNFIKQYPTTQINKEELFSEIQKVQQFAINQAKRSGLDAIDQAHTGYAFPRVIVDGKDYGRMSGDGTTKVQPKPAGSYDVPESMVKHQIPKNVDPQSLFIEKGLPKWKDPDTGDIVTGNKDLLSTPAFKKLQ